MTLGVPQGTLVRDYQLISDDRFYSLIKRGRIPIKEQWEPFMKQFARYVLGGSTCARFKYICVCEFNTKFNGMRKY